MYFCTLQIVCIYGDILQVLVRDIKSLLVSCPERSLHMQFQLGYILATDFVMISSVLIVILCIVY